jgi:hypothetical protein
MDTTFRISELVSDPESLDKYKRCKVSAYNKTPYEPQSKVPFNVG